MPVLIGLCAVLAGVLSTVQSGANATLNKALGQPILAALVVVAANLVVYLIASLFVGVGWPEPGRIAQTPWWAWVGGLCGGVYVLSAIFLAERLGAAVFTGLVVTAGIITSIALDHFGLVGFRQHTAGLWRLAGGAIMIFGLLLVSIA